MTQKLLDKKLARLLQERGKHSSYTACLRAVQKHILAHPEQTGAQIREEIAKGALDP